MRIAVGAAVAALCVLLSATAFARGPYGSITVGNWQGGAYTDDKNGAFTHCAAGTTYQSGIYFVVSIGENGSWRLGFAHDSWRLDARRGLSARADVRRPAGIQRLRHADRRAAGECRDAGQFRRSSVSFARPRR